MIPKAKAKVAESNRVIETGLFKFCRQWGSGCMSVDCSKPDLLLFDHRQPASTALLRAMSFHSGNQKSRRRNSLCAKPNPSFETYSKETAGSDYTPEQYRSTSFD